MVRATFALGILFNGATAVVFFLNFVRPQLRACLLPDASGGEGVLAYRRYRHPASLICANLALGWCVALAREMQWLPRPVTSVFIAAAIPMGLLGLLIVLNARRQR